jgi:hypothetical protein
MPWWQLMQDLVISPIRLVATVKRRHQVVASAVKVLEITVGVQEVAGWCGHAFSE